MPDCRLLQSNDTGLLIVDLQQPLLNVMWNQETLIANVRRLAEGARILGLPCLVMEQNPEKLGPTAACIAETLVGVTPFPKMTFSGGRDDAVKAALEESGRNTWLVCGVEAHVCVTQTALDLLGLGYCLHVAADAVGSRTQANWEAGLTRMRGAGATLTTTEMALFELLERAGTEQFRAVQKLVK